MPRSEITVEFAEKVKNRLLGNADDQATLEIDEKPKRKFVTGVIYTLRDQSNQLRYQDYKSKVTPNSYSVELSISEASFKIFVKTSFWLWLQTKHEDTNGPLVGDLFTDEVIWTPWVEQVTARAPEPVATQEKIEDSDESDDDEAHSKYIFTRKRYCKFLEFPQIGEIAVNGKTRDNPWRETLSLDDDLQRFGRTYSYLGRSSRWKGSVTAEAWSEKGISKLKVTVVNSTQDQRGEPCWFDARMEVKTDKMLKETFVPELDQSTLAITNNCIPEFDFQATGREIRVEQVGSLKIMRKQPIHSVSFKEVAEDPIAASTKVLKELHKLGANERTIADVTSSVNMLQSNQKASKAISLTSQVFQNYFVATGVQDARWHLFQITTLLTGAGMLLGSNPIPIVENVPTNAGKTEAFFSCMLFATFYGRLVGKRSVNVVKYPYRMLSRQQKERVAAYMIFAEEIATKQSMERLVLGYFAGMTKATKPGLIGQNRIVDEVAKQCPLCQSGWGSPVRLYESDEAASLECKNGHKLYMATGDAVFAAAPAIIIATPDKFVAKSYKDEMGSILGSLFYHCTVHGYTVHSRCKRDCTGSLQPADPVQVGFWILDEAHLIREEEGTKETHYEKGHTDIARLNSGFKVVPIISTATISGIDHFINHLGFGRDYVMVPAEKDRELFLETVHGENEVHHVVIAIEPRNRAVVFALGRMVEEWVNVAEQEHLEIGKNIDLGNPLSHLAHMLLYFPSYDKLYQTWDQLVNDVNRNRRSRGQADLRIKEATGRLLESEIEEWFDQVGKHQIDVTMATKLASIGIDVENLNVLGFYGVPTQISEFVQVLNRTARRTPGIAFIVLDPGKERDRSYYDYMDLFVTKADSQLVEEIPLNRFARSAIRYTFCNVLFSLLLFHYGPKNHSDYRRAQNVSADLASGQLPEADVVSRLKSIFLVSEDATGAYSPIVDELWKDFKLNLLSPGTTFIWDNYWGKKWLPNSLRGTSDQDVTVISDKTVDDALYYQLVATRATEDEAEDADVSEDTGA